jgi:hypothetical protein
LILIFDAQPVHETAYYFFIFLHQELEALVDTSDLSRAKMTGSAFFEHEEIIGAILLLGHDFCLEL